MPAWSPWPQRRVQQFNCWELFLYDVSCFPFNVIFFIIGLVGRLEALTGRGKCHGSSVLSACVCVNVWMSVSLHWVGWASSHVPALYLHTAASDHSPFPGILVWLPILKRMNPWKNVPRGNITKFLCFGLGFNPHFNKLSELSCDGVLVVPLIQLAFADVRMLTINGDDANSFQKSLHEITFMYYVMSQLYSFMYG